MGEKVFIRHERENGFWWKSSKPVYDAICENCHKHFETNREHTRTCSDKCRKALSRKSKNGAVESVTCHTLSTSASNLKLLDLCCGEGLAAYGYWLTGRLKTIVGIDTADMKKPYPFDFIQMSATALDYGFLEQFDFIHASPPCQWYSKVTPKSARDNHWRSIPLIRAMLDCAGKPYVIENVEGSGRDLEPTTRLYGYDVGLPISRVRYFRCSWMSSSCSLAPGANENINAHLNAVHGDFVSRAELEKLFGLDCVPYKQRCLFSVKGIKQGIPPAMTKRLFEDYLAKMEKQT